MQYHASLWCWGFIILLEHIEDDDKGVVFSLSPPGAQHNNDDCGGSGGGIRSTSVLATMTTTTKATRWSKTAQMPTKGGGIATNVVDNGCALPHKKRWYSKSLLEGVKEV